MKIIYKIVGHESNVILTSMVNDLLKSDWKLSGGLCIGKGMFWQSIYREETKRNFMFNKFFKGTIDDLLNKVADAPIEAINKVGNPDEILNREEMIALMMDDYKMERSQAEHVVTEIQMEELDRISKGMVEKGLLEIVAYDSDGNPEYKPTLLGLQLLKQ